MSVEKAVLIKKKASFTIGISPKTNFNYDSANRNSYLLRSILLLKPV